MFALGAKLPGRDEVEPWAIFLYNGSSKPIYDVRIESQKVDGSSANHLLTLGAVPPGQFVIPSHPQYHWGALIDLNMKPEDTQLLVKGKGAKMITRVRFADASRQEWELNGGNRLVESATD